MIIKTLIHKNFIKADTIDINILRVYGGKTMIKIRYVEMRDQSFWFQLDQHLSKTEFEKKVRDKMGYVILENETPVGLLRYNLFWDNTPFCTLLFIDSAFQGKGYGSMLMHYWENDMKKQGYGMLLTSTQTDETTQHFYRKLHYQDCGGLIVNIPKYAQPMELFLVKDLSI